jgi:hypothetical protein
MNRKRLTKIESATWEKTVIRFRRNAAVNIFCRDCCENARHFSITQAAQILSISEAAVFRATEFGQIHSTETASGALYVCGNSVLALTGEKNLLKEKNNGI